MLICNDLPRRDAAIVYAEHGFKVILLHGVHKPDPTVPICTCNKGIFCRGVGKHPRFNNWVTLATTDTVLISEWFRVKSNSNIGLAMGFDGIIALDIDGNYGHETLKALEVQYEELPQTLTQQTGRGGVSEHRLYYVDRDAISKIRNTTNKLGKGLDIRAGGALIVAAPSIHKGGGKYAWKNDLAIQPLPPWFTALLATAPSTAPSSSFNRPEETSLPSVLRRMTRARRYLYFAPSAVEGQNGSLVTFKAALAVVRGFCVPAKEAFEILRDDYNPRCEPSWSDQELMHKVESAENDASLPWGYLLDE